MSKRTDLSKDQIDGIGIWQAATADGYWEDAATRDLQYVYKLGQLKAARSFHASYGNRSTLKRVQQLRKEVEALEAEVIR